MFKTEFKPCEQVRSEYTGILKEWSVGKREEEGNTLLK
jgi:hypothetical protein